MNMEEVAAFADPLHLQDIQNAEHSSFFFKTPEYTLLITRLFTMEKEGLVGVSTPYLITSDATLAYDRFEGNFPLLPEGHRSVQASIEKQLEQSEKLIERYLEEIDRLEDSLYNRHISPIFLDVWFDLKKDLTRMDRILERVDKVLKQYMNHYDADAGFPGEGFINILEHVGRYQRLANLHAFRLDTLYSYYNSLKNDKINNNIYVLTILSGVFLPLNLVVGFFGMNTQNLYFNEDPQGTVNVVFLLVSLFVLLIAVFPLARIVEHYILRRLLGRFSLYNNLVDGIRKITLFSK